MCPCPFEPSRQTAAFQFVAPAASIAVAPSFRFGASFFCRHGMVGYSVNQQSYGMQPTFEQNLTGGRPRTVAELIAQSPPAPADS